MKPQRLRSIFTEIFTLWMTICALQACGGRGAGEASAGETGEKTKAVVSKAVPDLDEIVASGELIMATLSGPETYYDYHGAPMGREYAFAAAFAESEGLRLRVELCSDTAGLFRLLSAGEADLVVVPLTQAEVESRHGVAVGQRKDSKHFWAANAATPLLAEALNRWASTVDADKLTRRETERETTRRVVRRQVKPRYLNEAAGVISSYDNLFKDAAARTGWDWRLIAAQCYQESGFDPEAVSGAGARGLMQIMPTTAAHYGVSAAELFEAEKNVRTAGSHIAALNKNFLNIRSNAERIKFVLAAYNGGEGHIRDAMRLCEKYGGNASQWADVRTYVLRLQQARYYRDPVVQHGYMIGSETAEYVDRILSAYQAYGGVSLHTTPSSAVGINGGAHTHKKNRHSGTHKILTPEELSRM